MFMKITFVAFLVVTCSCVTPPHPEVTKSNQAVYSQSFNREDVPLSYSYSAVHNYTPKQQQYQAENMMTNDKTTAIQYAPLPVQYKQQQNDAGLFTRVPYTNDYSKTVMPEDSTETNGWNHYLEPKSESKHPASTNSAVYNQFIPEHNSYVAEHIKLLRPSDRNPTNDDHRYIPQIEKKPMGHYWDLHYEEPQGPFLTVPTHRPTAVEKSLDSTTQIPKTLTHAFVPKPQPAEYMNFYTKGRNDQPLGHAGHVLSAKMPQLHLNSARDYKMARYQLRIAPAQISQARFYTYPLNTHKFVNPQSKKSPSDTPRLNPLPNHLHLSAYSRS